MLKIRAIRLVSIYTNRLKLRMLQTLLRILTRSPLKTAKAVSNLRVVTGPLTYSDGVLSSKQNCSFIHDSKFRQAYEVGKKTQSWGKLDLEWRVYNALYFAEYAASLDGDFVECGVHRGGLVRSVIEYVDFAHLAKRFYLLDTYDGFVDKYVSEKEVAIGATSIQYEDCYEYVKNLFEPFPNVVIIRGAVPETLTEVNTDKVAFLSIDMNCVEPEIAAVEYFWEDKLVKGGIVLLDDYGWPTHIYQKKAFDEFAKKKNLPILSLPTGQGALIKA